MYNIVYSTDENYCRHVAVSITSLLMNNEELKDINIYIVENNLSQESKKKLKRIVEKYDKNLIFLSCNELCKNLKVNTDFPKAAFSRLFLASKLKNIDKILYIDSDTYVNKGIKDLYDTNIDDYEIAGVQDNAAYYLLKKIGMDKTDRYINSGVLLINLKKWRQDDVEKKICDFTEKHNGRVNHNDQGIINGVCRKKIYILNPKYNMMPEMIYLSVKQSNFLYKVYNYYTQEEITNAVENPVIVHYIEKFYSRPWKKDCTHPLKSKYLDILNKSEFDKKLEENGLNKKVQFRKKIYENVPFIIYAIVEKILNIRRIFL